MYGILLVDDEKLELEILLNYVKWDDFNIEILGTARNGREALKKFEILRPKIILTDVKMPVMDGIEFAKKAKAIDPDVKIIFLSGYDEFDFVKAAIDIEASGYLLKPLDVVELYHLMQKVKSKCDEEKVTCASMEILLEEYLREFLFEKCAERHHDILNRIRTLEVGICNYIHAPISVSVAALDGFVLFSRQNAVSHVESVYNGVHSCIKETLGSVLKVTSVIRTREGKYGLLAPEADSFEKMPKSKWQELLDNVKKFYGFTLTICIAGCNKDIGAIPALYRAAESAVEMRFYYGGGKIFHTQDIQDLETLSEAKIPDIKDYLLNAVIQCNEEASIRKLESFYHTLCDERVSRDRIFSISFDLLNALCEFLPTHSKELTEVLGDKNSLWKGIAYQDTIAGIETFMKTTVLAIIQAIRPKCCDNSAQVVGKVLSIIENNFNKILTVDQISREVYLSPNYIRTIFKEKTGETILEYLTKYRIKKAAELLGDKSLKIHEVAKAVGYENTSYFCSLFCRYHGITPNEYRKRIL